MKKIQKQKFDFVKYLTSTFWQFVEHLKIGKKVLLTTVYDLVFWLLVFGTTYLAGLILRRDAVLLGSINFNQQAILASQALTQTNITLIKTFAIRTIMLFAFLALIILLLYTLMKCFVWTTLFDKKANKQYFTAFFKLNLIWWIIWTAIALFLLLGVQEGLRNYLVITFSALYLHFTTTLQTIFTQKNSIKEAFTATIMTGIGKLHHFIVPYVFFVLFYLLLTRILYLLPSRSVMMVTAAIIILLFSIAWFRNYVKDVVLAIDKNVK